MKKNQRIRVMGIYKSIQASRGKEWNRGYDSDGSGESDCSDHDGNNNAKSKIDEEGDEEEIVDQRVPCYMIREKSTCRLIWTQCVVSRLLWDTIIIWTH